MKKLRYRETKYHARNSYSRGAVQQGTDSTFKFYKSAAPIPDIVSGTANQETTGRAQTSFVDILLPPGDEDDEPGNLSVSETEFKAISLSM